MNQEDAMVSTQPLTIGAVRDQHLALMREWRGLDSDAKRAVRAIAFRAEVEAAGADIEQQVERDEAQGIIDYWASEIAALPGQAYPDLLKMAEYKGNNATIAAQSVREVYDAAGNAQLMARSILVDLLALNEGMVVRGRPRDRETLRRSAGAADTEQFDSILDQLVATGAIVFRPGETHDDARFEIADARIVESWPDLDEWLREAEKYSAERDRLLDMAHLWDAAGRDPTLLLMSSQGVRNALSFCNEDDLLDAFIDASESQRTKWRRISSLIGIAAIFALGAASFYLWVQNRAISRDRDKARVETAEVKRILTDTTRKNVEADKRVESIKAEQIETKAMAELADSFVKPEVDSLAYSGDPGFDAVSKLPLVTGAMWLGSDFAPQVRGLNRDQPEPFSAARAGSRYRARAPIYLRQEMPKSEVEYKSPRQKAIVPGGAQVVLLGPPVAYKRETGIQYWAQVRVIPLVYVQYTNGSRREVDAFRAQLAAIGFEVPPAELLPSAKSLSEVRFLRNDDQPLAQLLRDRLQTLPVVSPRGTVGCQLLKLRSAALTNFKLEVWFDFRRPAAAGSVSRCQ
jgi:hypothetical protein